MIRCPTSPSSTGATIAFDLDGTLVDTAPDLIGCLNSILVEEGLPALPISPRRGAWSATARGVMLEHGFAAGRPAARRRRARGRWSSRFIARLPGPHRRARAGPSPAVVEALDALRAAGAQARGLHQQADRPVAGAAARPLDLDGRFAAVVGPDATPARKPDPRHLLDAIAAAGGDPARAVYRRRQPAPTSARPRRPACRCVGVSFGYADAPAAELGFDAADRQLRGIARALVRDCSPLPADPCRVRLATLHARLPWSSMGPGGIA